MLVTGAALVSHPFMTTGEIQKRLNDISSPAMAPATAKIITMPLKEDLRRWQQADQKQREEQRERNLRFREWRPDFDLPSPAPITSLPASINSETIIRDLVQRRRDEYES